MKRIAIDLDGTLAHYDHWRGCEHIGEPLPGAVEFTKLLRDLGFWIAIYSCRNMKGDTQNIQIVSDWLRTRGFYYDEIFLGKKYADWYIDDKAISCTPQTDPKAYSRILERLK